MAILNSRKSKPSEFVLSKPYNAFRNLKYNNSNIDGLDVLAEEDMNETKKIKDR